MTITRASLVRASGLAATTAGAIFVGVNIGHPHLDATTVGTTDVLVRSTLKVVMAMLALAGISGMYLSQVRRNGVLGLVGYVTFAFGYLMLMIPPYIAAFVLPQVAGTDPAYVNDVLAAATARPLDGDIGPLQTVLMVQGLGYLAGGTIFGIALFRARVLTRWATVLLAVSGVATAALSVMPDALYRLLAFPNGIAMVVLGYSLWRSARDTAASPEVRPAGRRTAPSPVGS